MKMASVADARWRLAALLDEISSGHEPLSRIVVRARREARS